MQQVEWSHIKKEIINNFSTSVNLYENEADIQKEVAKRLSKALTPWKDSIPDGPVMEIGAGTGFFTEYLLEMYTDRQLCVSDISEEMLLHCNTKFDKHSNLNIEQLDAESAELEEAKYSLIAANYVVHWLKNPALTLSRMLPSLKVGGLILVSFPAKESFSNWRQYCLDLGIPFTANSLPDLEQVVIELSNGPVKVDYYEDELTISFDNVFNFFRQLKRTGASSSMSGKQLSVKQLNLLNDYWQKQDGGKVKANYHTAYIAVKRDIEY